MSVVGPSHFVDVYNVSYNSVAIYSVSSIKINRQRKIITGIDNNKLRPVSSHTVGIGETVEIDTDDVNAISALLSSTGAHDLTFNWLAAGQQLTTSPLPTQLVTVKNVVIDTHATSPNSKALGGGRITGMVLETSDSTDPVVFATGS